MDTEQDIPYGYCHCGCGEQTRIAKRDHAKSGHVKGEPVRFVFGHHFRLDRQLGPRWIEQDCGYVTPCWIWQLALNDYGYGLDHHRLAHRRTYESERGPIPRGMHLDHLCRVRNCVNPDHLEPVTNTENQRRGLNARISPGKAQEIRRLYATGQYSQRALGARFGISHNRVGEIVRGEAWRID